MSHSLKEADAEDEQQLNRESQRSWTRDCSLRVDVMGGELHTQRYRLPVPA